MRRVLAMAIACLMLLTVAPARAGEQGACAAVYGCAWDQAAGRAKRFLLFPAGDEAPGAQEVLDALLKHMSTEATATVSVANTAARVDFSEGTSLPTNVRRNLFDAIARTLLLFDEALTEVTIPAAGSAPYMTRAELVYNPNLDSSGNYIDPQNAPTSDAQRDALPHVSDDSVPPSDEATLNTLAFGAADWIERIARAAGAQGFDFEGVPTAEFAWRLIIEELQIPREGSDDSMETAVEPLFVTAAYNRQFAFGCVPSVIPRDAGIARALDLYRLTGQPDETSLDAVINDASVDEEGDIAVDLSVLNDTDGAEAFVRNMKITFTPDAATTGYGMKLSGLSSLPRAEAFPEASVVRAADGTSISTQPTADLTDGDLNTGWLAGSAGGEGALMLSGDAREVRGLLLTPINGSGDISEIRVTLSDGNVYEQAFEGGQVGEIAMPFDGVQTVEWLRIELIGQDGALRAGLAEVEPF